MSSCESCSSCLTRACPLYLCERIKCDFRLGHRLVDELSPVSRESHGAGDQELRRSFVSPELDAGPVPVFSQFDHVGSQSVPFDVSQNREVVLIIFDGKGFEPPLPHVA